MREQLTQWLSSGKQQITLFEDCDAIILRRHAGTLQLSVQLTQHPPARPLLETWMRLGSASLGHFHGALAQAPTTGVLWLVQCRPEGSGEQCLLDALEDLLNQRDTWRAIATRLASPSQKPSPASLRSLAR